MPDRVTIKFQVSLRPESAGIRIKTTDPTGVYVSVADRDTATTFFEYAVLELAVERGLVDRYPAQEIGNKPDWSSIIDKGYGEIVITTVTQAEVDETKKTGTQIFQSSQDAAIVDHWRDPNDEMFIIVRDNGIDYVDRWIVDELIKDLDSH